MGEHETVAALAQQLDEIRTELATFRARLETETGPVMVVQVAQKRQREKLEDLEKKVAELASATAKHGGQAEDDEPSVPRWDGTGQDALRGQFDKLHQWVEGWLRPQFPGYLKSLPDCWPAHREALWELGTLHASWQQVIGDEDEPALDGVRWWLDRWLPGTLSRLRTVNCPVTGCNLKNPGQPGHRPRGAYPAGPVDLAFRDMPRPPA